MADLKRSCARPRIVLHIGRNKAGSTTIQDACLGERPALSAQGVDYVLFGHLAASREDTPGFPTFETLRAHAIAHAGRTLLVSNEFMFGWPDAFTEAAAGVLRDCDVQILAYVRRYDDWIVSAYAEETRKGMNLRDIDAYVDWMGPRISAWPYLSKWAEGFGWDALRVRPLDARALRGGELMSDFAEALGVAPFQGSPRPSNPSPHWLELELVRRLAERNGDTEWSGVGHAEAEPLLAELRPLLDGVESASYLRRQTRSRLLALYAADLARIAEAAGDVLAAPAPAEGPEAARAPCFEHAPAALLDAFFARTTDAGFGARHPEASARAARMAQELGRSPST